MLAAEIEHFLGFGQTADERAGEAAASKDESHYGNWQRLFGHTDLGEIAIACEEVDIGVDVMFRGNGIENEVEGSGVLDHLVRISGDDDFVSAEAEGVLLLVWRSGEDNNMRTESAGELYGHVAEAAEPNYPNFLAFSDTPMAKGRVSGDACAEEGRGTGKIEICRDTESKTLVNDNVFGISTVGHGSGAVFIRAIVSENGCGAELFKAIRAVWTSAIRIDEATDGGNIARLKSRDRGSDLCHATNNFMARNTGINGLHDATPLVANGMQVGMADAAEQDFNLDVVPGRFAAGNCGGSQGGSGAGGGISFGVVHKKIRADID